MNIKLLEQVKAMVLKYPENVCMAWWVTGDVLVADKQDAPQCGTTGCIAGWTVAVHDGAAKIIDGNSFGISHRAQEYLGFCEPKDWAGETGEANRLFYADNWPPVFLKAYINSRTPEEEAQVIADRIDHFIQTEGRE